MQNNLVETVVGAAVIGVAALFGYYAFSTADAGSRSGYPLVAKFQRADGIARGSDVKIAGVKVGTVIEQSLDPATYFAKVVISIDSAVKVPADSSIKISSDGLLGGASVSIEPGPSDEMMAANAEFEFTQSSVDLVGLIGQAVFSTGKSGAPEAPQ